MRALIFELGGEVFWMGFLMAILCGLVLIALMLFTGVIRDDDA